MIKLSKFCEEKIIAKTGQIFFDDSSLTHNLDKTVYNILALNLSTHKNLLQKPITICLTRSIPFFCTNPPFHIQAPQPPPKNRWTAFGANSGPGLAATPRAGPTGSSPAEGRSSCWPGKAAGHARAAL